MSRRKQAKPIRCYLEKSKTKTELKIINKQLKIKNNNLTENETTLKKFKTSIKLDHSTNKGLKFYFFI